MERKREFKVRVKRKEEYKYKPKAIFESYNNHDCETIYSCPKCFKKFSSWDIFSQRRKLNENGTNKYCPNCKNELDGLD